MAVREKGHPPDCPLPASLRCAAFPDSLELVNRRALSGPEGLRQGIASIPLVGVCLLTGRRVPLILISTPVQTIMRAFA
jgi:hypothetical protein